MTTLFRYEERADEVAAMPWKFLVREDTRCGAENAARCGKGKARCGAENAVRCGTEKRGARIIGGAANERHAPSALLWLERLRHKRRGYLHEERVGLVF